MVKTKSLTERSHSKRSTGSKAGFEMRRVPHLKMHGQNIKSKGHDVDSPPPPPPVTYRIFDCNRECKMDILETQLHQKKQNPSYADGFWGQEKAAKIQSHHSPEARDSLRGPEKINRDPKCQSQRFGPSEIPLGRRDPPALLTSPPARLLQPGSSLGHNTETVSR